MSAQRVLNRRSECPHFPKFPWTFQCLKRLGRDAASLAVERLEETDNSRGKQHADFVPAMIREQLVLQTGVDIQRMQRERSDATNRVLRMRGQTSRVNGSDTWERDEHGRVCQAQSRMSGVKAPLYQGWWSSQETRDTDPRCGERAASFMLLVNFQSSWREGG